MMVIVHGSPLYQWDINRQLLIDSADLGSDFVIHCCYTEDSNALVVEPKTVGDKVLINIPNILLQRFGSLRVYVVTEGDTVYDATFYVMARPKPDDYVYTETEVLSYVTLSKRMDELEKNGVSEEKIANAVGDYLSEHPITENDPTVPAWAKASEKPKYTAKEVGALSPKDITLAEHTDGLIYLFVNGEPVGIGLNLSGGGNVEPDIPDVPDEPIEPDTENLYKAVTWNTQWSYNCGSNEDAKYTAWCPHNLQYDKTRNIFVFLQCHRASHTGAYSNMTLCALNPENPLEYEMLNCPTYAGLGALLITEDGTWYIWDNLKRYTSTDGGTTWKTEYMKAGLTARFGIYEIDGVLYAGDDSGNAGVYRISKDYGITWEEKNFGVPYTDCEASFCKFKGTIYAFLRKNTTETDDPNYLYAAIYKSTDGENWEFVNDDKLLAKSSYCCPVAFDDYIAIAHISRADRHLYYTVWDGNESFETTDFGVVGGKDGDFHTPSLAFGNGYACIAFMNFTFGTSYTSAYNVCQNNWVVGTYDNTKETLVVSFEKLTYTGSDTAEKVKNLGFTSAYPEGSEIKAHGTVRKGLGNDNDYPIYIYNPDDRMVNFYAGRYGNERFRNGKALTFGCVAGTTTEIGTGTCAFEINGKYYHITNRDSSEHHCIQWKPIINESSTVTDAYPTEEVSTQIQVPANSYKNITDATPYQLTYKQGTLV